MSTRTSPSQYPCIWPSQASWTIALFGYWAQAQLLDSTMAEFDSERRPRRMFSAEMFA